MVQVDEVDKGPHNAGVFMECFSVSVKFRKVIFYLAAPYIKTHSKMCLC